MALKTVPKITKKQITENGVQKLADRPNLSGQYGASGLSAAQLKLWFDKLATLLAERINEIVDTISSDEAANYIRVCLDEYGVDNLGALITAFTDGVFAAKILQLFPSAGSAQKQTLQAVINNVAKELSQITETIKRAQETIDHHREVESGLKILYGTHGQPTFYLSGGRLYVRIIKGSVNPYRIENGRLKMTIVKEV